jgi:hypothetical protein
VAPRSAKEVQGGRVEDVEGGAGDPVAGGGVAAGEQAHGAHVVGLDEEVAVVDDAAQGLQVGLGFDQHLAGQHDLLAGGGELAGHLQPVGRRSSWRREHTVSPR